ncbi:MAG: hypothetical protein Q9173_006706 [Seirophora scorigena]
MPSSESDQVLLALKLLASIPNAVLKPHWRKIKATFRKLEGQMQGSRIRPIVTAISSSTASLHDSTSRSEVQIDPRSGDPSQNTTTTTQFRGPNPASSSSRAESHVPPSKSTPQSEEFPKAVQSFISKLMEQFEKIETFIKNHDPSKTTLPEHDNKIDDFPFDDLKVLARALKSHDDLTKFAEERPDWIDRWQGKYDASFEAINSTNSINSPHGLDTKAYSNPSLESHRHNHLKRPAQCDPSNQQKRQRRSPTSGEPDPTFASGSDADDDGEDKHEDTDDEQEDENEDKEDEDKNKDKEDGSNQDDQSDRGKRRFTEDIQTTPSGSSNGLISQGQSPSHEQPPHCEPSGNQAERDCSEGASCHSGPNSALNGSAASSRSGTAVLKSFLLDTQVNYQSPYPPLAQSGSGAPSIHESHASGHTLPHPRSNSVEHNIQETLPITQAQAALCSDRSEAASSGTAFEHGSLTQPTQEAQSPALNQIEQSQEGCGSMPSGNFGRIPHATSVTDTTSGSFPNIYQNDFMAGTDPANSNLPDALAGQQFNHPFERTIHTQQELPNQNSQQMCPDAWCDTGDIDLAAFGIDLDGSFMDSIHQSEIDLADSFFHAQPPPLS